MPPLKCRIVLVRPRDPNNIGAAARAMKNFGFTDLAVVTPYPPVWDEAVSAVNALDVLTNARVCASLAEAVADCTLVIGTADHRRVAGKQFIYTPRALQRELQTARHQLALVFGSEKTGLSNDDLSHCHRVMSILTAPDCPSMNLGQAVAICCYELIRDDVQPASLPPTQTATAGAIEASLVMMVDVLRRIDFIRAVNEPELTRRLRASLLRLRPRQRDVEMLCGILDRIQKTLPR
jgi:TrmH family RNA methyltransferase